MKREDFTILVVDDEPLVRVALETVLQWSGYRVVLASDGDEALTLLESVPIDLLLTDLAMPGREGIETIIEVRRRFPHVKVIAMSGVYGGFCLEMARQLGASAAVSKPVSNAVLLRRVDTTLNLRGPARQMSAAH